MRQLPQTTESICPICRCRLPAQRLVHNGQVRLERECPEHGRFSTLIGESPAEYLGWQAAEMLTPPELSQTKTLAGCPFDCGLCPTHKQQACCIVLEISDQCDQGCRYCFADSQPTTGPKDGPAAAGNLADLSLPQLESLLRQWYRQTAERPYNVQLSGGEPTLRGDLPEIVALIRQIGFPYVQLNTNGRKLAESPELCARLAEAGLSAVFLQFDGVTDEVYQAIRGRPLFQIKETAIANLRAVGLSTVLAVTVVPGVNDRQIGALIDYAIAGLPWIRGLHFQPVTHTGRFPQTPTEADRLTLFRLAHLIEEQTAGRMRYADFLPLATGSSYCSFHGRFIVEKSGRWRAVSPPAGATCCDKSAIVKARDFIGRQWEWAGAKSAADPITGLTNPTPAPAEGSFDELLDQLQNRSLSITAMGFQDVWTLDLERLQRCRVQVGTTAGHLIPFCAYNCFYR